MTSGLLVGDRAAPSTLRLATFARCARSSPLPCAACRRVSSSRWMQVERALGAVDEDEAARPDGEDLARELGADRAAGAGDEHRPVRG